MPVGAGGASCVVQLEERVHVVEFSPFPRSAGLIAVGCGALITLGACSLQIRPGGAAEERAACNRIVEEEGLVFTRMKSYEGGARVHALAWSPDTHLGPHPQMIRFCSATADKKIRVYRSDLQGSEEVQELEGHNAYVNAVAFEPTDGHLLASVSDDNTCRIWDDSGDQQVCLPLLSPGASVCWSSAEPDKLLVGERGGRVQVYSTRSWATLLSLDCGAPSRPLMMADWSPLDPVSVGAVAGADWLLWDSSRGSWPVERKPAHLEGASQFRWCRTVGGVFATTSPPGRLSGTLLIHNLAHVQPALESKVPALSGLSWHPQLPLCACGSDRSLCFWLLEL
ncbi:nucleoporin Nup37 isoform X4 [Petromyzon marinus]|nr:nucleoporin Nup37 isoform X2 [Petromyzon marinus]XP_032805271.1 nucleoporin Nup37 isoform X2 [Petromyzon marinus]XP_032805272.1 nucleoporin Nup37 isoform X2 [Petromyzon marinus]